MNNSFFVHSSSSTSETLRNEVIGADLQNDAGMESSVNISEVFVDYVHPERTTGKAIADAIVKSLHDMGFDIENLRGQGYDGATDQELQEQFHAATTLVESAGGVVSQPRVSGRQQHRNNSPAETPEAYYRRNVAIPFLDHLLKEMETRFDQSSRTCSVIFKLIPKLLLAVDDLQDLCDKLMFWRTDLPSPMSLLSELKYWKNSHSKDLTVTNLIEWLRCCDRDVFPKIYELLCLGCVAPVSSCEAERLFSGLRRIKTHLRNSMTVERLAGWCQPTISQVTTYNM